APVCKENQQITYAVALNESVTVRCEVERNLQTSLLNGNSAIQCISIITCSTRARSGQHSHLHAGHSSGLRDTILLGQ
ncbi:hypothetical protein TNCT_358981, partial [Trichonephila clavata]